MSEAGDERVRPEEDESDDRPWNEERWEQEMRASDVRAARFGELLETLMDEPNCEEEVAREMGWTELSSELAADREAGMTDGEFGDAAAGVYEPASDFEEDDFDEGIDDDDEPPVESIPAYVIAMDAGEKVWQALERYCRQYSGQEEAEEGRVNPRVEDIGELLAEARIGCHIAAAKLTGGHTMGYEDDMLCGHIVNLRRGLEGVEQADKALRALREMNAVPHEVIDALLPEVKRVIDAMQQRIAELRARVWW